MCSHARQQLSRNTPHRPVGSNWFIAELLTVRVIVVVEAFLAPLYFVAQIVVIANTRHQGEWCILDDGPDLSFREVRQAAITKVLHSRSKDPSFLQAALSRCRSNYSQESIPRPRMVMLACRGMVSSFNLSLQCSTVASRPPMNIKRSWPEFSLGVKLT